VINATFSNISAISWRPVLVVEEHSMAFFVESLLTCYSRQAQIFLYAYEMCHLSFRINTFFLGSYRNIVESGVKNHKPKPINKKKKSDRKSARP
jgi:hypothetical protein